MIDLTNLLYIWCSDQYDIISLDSFCDVGIKINKRQQRMWPKVECGIMC